MRKLIPLIITLLLLGYTPQAEALYGNFEEFETPETNEIKTPIIPKGSYFRGFMGQTVSSEFNNSEDIVKILVTAEFTIDNYVVLPKNTIFVGKVKNLEKAQQGMDGHFSIDIVAIIFPDGKSFNAKGYVVAPKNKRIFGGDFSKRSGHRDVVHRSECFGRKGVLQLKQNGPRKIGEETKIKMGEWVTILLEEPIELK